MLVKLSKDVSFLRTRVDGHYVELTPGQTVEMPSFTAIPLIADGKLVKSSYPDIRNDAVVVVEGSGEPHEAVILNDPPPTKPLRPWRKKR